MSRPEWSVHEFFVYPERSVIMEKKLCKSSVNRMLAGVCGGIAEYLDVDPTVVRLIWVGVTILGGAGLLAYIAAAILMPQG